MRMSTKGRLAVNALIDLALRESAGPVALLSISERQQVSLSYLEQMFSRLRRQGVVESTRGPGGGYTLGRPAAQISVADIVAAVDETDDVQPRTGLVDGLSTQLWRELDAVMLAHLATISLQRLVDEQRASGAAVEARTPKRALAPVPLAVSNVTRLPLRCNAPNSVFAFGRSFAA
jgi:Rrf2 family iron-sulfur cluster assembly transcriptional regulator